LFNFVGRLELDHSAHSQPIYHLAPIWTIPTMSAFPTHTHHSEYADPVMRVPSPASSVGTSYGADQTAHSDSEAQLSPAAFARKCSERIGLHLPRTEEFRADQDPLLTVLTPQGRFVRASERDVGAAEVQSAFSCLLLSGF
jgi:hypothetical protein